MTISLSCRAGHHDQCLNPRCSCPVPTCTHEHQRSRPERLRSAMTLLPAPETLPGHISPGDSTPARDLSFDLDGVIVAYRSGTGLARLAAEHGMSKGRLRRLLVDAGVEIHPFAYPPVEGMADARDHSWRLGMVGYGPTRST